MCIQILKKEIISQDQYPNYKATNLIEQASRNTDYTLMKIEFQYKDQIGTMHILIRTEILGKPQAFVDSTFEEIALKYARENYYKVFQCQNMEEKQRFIIH